MQAGPVTHPANRATTITAFGDGATRAAHFSMTHPAGIENGNARPAPPSTMPATKTNCQSGPAAHKSLKANAVTPSAALTSEPLSQAQRPARRLTAKR